MKRLAFLVFFFVFAGGSLAAQQVISIPPTALNYYNTQSLSYRHLRDASVFCYTETSWSAEDIYLVAPLILPNGATLMKLTAYCTDNVDEEEARIQVWIFRAQLSTGQTDPIANIGTSGPGGMPGIREMTANCLTAVAIVDNTKYSYTLYVNIGRVNPNLKFHGAKVYYQLPFWFF